MQDKDRDEKHKRNFASDEIMSELKDMLQFPNDARIKDLPTTPYPNIYILGCPRSGTTFIHQFLVNTFDLSYPSNFISRFYYATYIGAKIQYLINNLDLKGELLNHSESQDYRSELGKTKGSLSPHEFTFYWRQFFSTDDSGYVEIQNQKEVNDFLAGLNAIKHVFKNPFVLKGIFTNNGISRFTKDRPDDLVIHVKRDVAFNAQSLIEARNEFFGDVSKWYSFGIPRMKNLHELSVEEQVVLQVIKTNELIENELQNLDANQVITIDYDHLDEELPRLVDILKKKNIKQKSTDVESFVPNNSVRLDQESWDSIQKLITKHSG